MGWRGVAGWGKAYDAWGLNLGPPVWIEREGEWEREGGRVSAINLNLNLNLSLDLNDLDINDLNLNLSLDLNLNDLDINDLDTTSKAEELSKTQSKTQSKTHSPFLPRAKHTTSALDFHHAA